METTEATTKTKWGIDPVHSEIGFKVKHLMITNVRGTFKEFDTSIYTTGEDFMTSEIDFRLNPASITTGDEKRVALTIKGINKQVKLDVEFGGVMKDQWGNHKAGFTINGKINRKDWGLNWNTALEAGGGLVSEDVYISCEVQLVKQS